MLKLILGAAGSGKTCYARELAGRCVEQGSSPVLIVPEQFSFESERAMLNLLGAQKANAVNVYSFTRLAEELLPHGDARMRMDDCGRVAAMGLALNQLSYQLEYYHDKAGKRSSAQFISHLLDAVKEFKLCAVTPQQLEEAASRADGTLHTKLSELALIYAAYEAAVAQTSLDPMDSLTSLARLLETERFFEGRTVIVDSFRSFTGQEYAVLGRIIAQAELCVVTIGAERGTPEEERSGLFAAPLTAMRRLQSIANEQGVKVAAIETLAPGRRFLSPALAAVERSVFRYGDEREEYEPETDDVVVYNAVSRYDELEFCARECRRLLREEGFRCRDIAIIARDESGYADIAADALELQGIPCFVDRRTDAASSALMRFVLSALEAVSTDWRSGSIMRWLKSGLVGGIDTYTAAELENYCYVWGIDGRKWLNPFEHSPDGFAPELSEVQRKRLEGIEAARALIVERLTVFREELRCETGAGMAAAVWHLIETCRAGERLERLRTSMSAAQADEQPQLWNALTGILDQLASVLGSARVTLADFAGYITLMIGRCDIGHIPQGLDEVTFGGADRLRVSSPRAVFIVGAVEGEFPKAPENSGVFTDDERRRLRTELELPVAEPLEEQYLEERLLAYSALSSGSERLYITCAAMSAGIGGQALERSECVGEVLACVKGARVIEQSDALSIERIEGEAAAFELAARHWMDCDPIETALIERIKARPDYSDRLAAVAEQAECTSPTLSSRERAHLLFSDQLRISPTQLETFFKCRFMYFCRYGLGANPRKKAQVDNLSMGTLAHYVLEQIVSEQGDKPFSTLTDNPAGVRVRVAGLIERFISEQMGGADSVSSSQLYALRGMTTSLTIVVLNLAEELSVSDFRPVAFELGVSDDGDAKPETVTLPDGTSVTITGKIDRVDCYSSCGRRWLRVIDYKLTGKKFLLSDVLDGVNVQMLIYLEEICREGSGELGGSIPAGIIYGTAASGSFSESRDITDDALEKKRMDDLRRSCLIIDDEETHEVVSAMEKGLGGRFIPITKKDGALRNGDKYMISPTGYRIVGKYVHWLIGQMGGELREGHVAPEPIDGRYLPCKYCDYAAICRYTGKTRARTKADNNETLGLMAAVMTGGKGE